MKAAFVLYNIVVIHPFLNGNKRTAFGLVGAFLEANGYELVSGSNDAYQFLLGVASGRVSETEVERWVVLGTAKPIPDKEFTKLAEGVISKNKGLLEMLAKVWPSQVRNIQAAAAYRVHSASSYTPYAR